jgi:Domain of unknown function (DUF4333)
MGQGLAAVRSRSQLAVAVLLGLAFGGCGTATIDTHQVEQGISNKLVKLRGVQPKSVACPRSMESTKGKAYRCTITAPAGGTIGVTVTMDGHGHFHFAVDQRPTS